MLHGLAAVINGLATVVTSLMPEAVAVVIVRIIFKLITHAMDDQDRWNRFLILIMPLLVAFLALVGVAAWWLLGDGGVQILLHVFSR